jgi:hypothetical protein
MEYTVETKNQYSPELEILRKICFPGPLNDNKDPFNEKSRFLIIKSENQIAASARLTNNPGGCFVTNTKALGTFLNDPDCVDLGKTLVSPGFRGNGLLEVLILTSLNWAYDNGYHFVNGGVIPGRNMVDRLKELHFRISGDTVTYYEPYGNKHLIHPLLCDINNSIKAIKNDLAFYTKRYELTLLS